MPVAIITEKRTGEMGIVVEERRLVSGGRLPFSSQNTASVCPLAGRDEASLRAVGAECTAKGINEDNASYHHSRRSHMWRSLPENRQNTMDKFNSIDTLINNAGILITGTVLDSPLEELDKLFDVNVRSMVQLTRLALPHLIASKGTVVNVSSVNGPCPFAGVTYYCMSKSAVDQFTKCLALEMAPHGVRVNAVNPGVIVTEIHKRAGQDEETYKKFLEHSRTTHALGRPGEAGEVARAIFFLATPASSFTTGDLLRVDGGRSIIHPR